MALKKIYTVISTGYELILPALAYSTIHRVLRNGNTVTPTVAPPPEYTNTFSYEYSTGQFLFGVPGNGQTEIIQIIYSGGLDVPPQPPPEYVCELPVGVTALVQENNSIQLNIPGTGQYRVTFGLASNPCGTDPMTEFTTTGPKTLGSYVFDPGDYKVCVKRLCGGDSESDWVSVPFTITALPPVPPVPNGIFKVNHAGGGRINSVLPAFYTLVGTFPTQPAFATRDIFHSGYTGKIIINVTAPTPLVNNYVKVKVAGVQVLCGPVFNGNNILPSVSFTAGQFFEIEYTSTPC